MQLFCASALNACMADTQRPALNASFAVPVRQAPQSNSGPGAPVSTMASHKIPPFNDTRPQWEGTTVEQLSPDIQQRIIG
jgi:hypothetical protein